MKPVLSTEEVVRLEDIIEREGTSKAELMELAGEFAANEILKLNPDRVLVLVGFGNNGGDGWVAADILAHKGVDVGYTFSTLYLSLISCCLSSTKASKSSFESRRPTDLPFKNTS